MQINISFFRVILNILWFLWVRYQIIEHSLGFFFQVKGTECSFQVFPGHWAVTKDVCPFMSWSCSCVLLLPMVCQSTINSTINADISNSLKSYAEIGISLASDKITY